MYKSKYEVGKKYAGKYSVLRVSIKEEDNPKYVIYADGKQQFKVKEEDFAKLIGSSTAVEDVPKNVPQWVTKRRDALRKKYVDGYQKKEDEKKIIDSYEKQKEQEAKPQKGKVARSK